MDGMIEDDPNEASPPTQNATGTGTGTGTGASGEKSSVVAFPASSPPASSPPATTTKAMTAAPVTVFCSLRLLGPTALSPEQAYQMLVETNAVTSSIWGWQDYQPAVPGQMPVVPTKAARRLQRKLLQTAADAGAMCNSPKHFAVADLSACKTACASNVTAQGGTANPVIYQTSRERA